MGAVTALPLRTRMTRDEFWALPDDGRRHELLDGVHHVSPAPRMVHQTCVLELAVLLRSACPAHLQVFVAPVDVVLGDDTVLQPDVLVARRRDLTYANLPAAPALAVEVLSPSNRRLDLRLKHAKYEAVGTRAYWVLDPDEARLRAWELEGGRYVEVADVRGDESFEATVPYAVTVVPATLLS